MRTLAAACTIPLLVLGAGAARADDERALDLFTEARAHWTDPSPEQALSLAERALGEEPSHPVLRARILLFQGCLHHRKTGDLTTADALYDRALAALAAEPSGDATLRLLEVEALVRKAGVAVARAEEGEALRLLLRAQEVHPRASTAAEASLACYRLGRRAAGSAEGRRYLDKALALAQQALAALPLEFAEASEHARRWQARLQAQVALCQDALGRGGSAAAAWERATTAAAPSDVCLYVRALYHARAGAEAAARACLEELLEAAESPVERAELRRAARREPDFAPHRAAWADLLGEED